MQIDGELLFSRLIWISAAGALLASLVWYRVIWKKHGACGRSFVALYLYWIAGFSIPALLGAALWSGTFSVRLLLAILAGSAALLLPVWLFVVALLAASKEARRATGERALVWKVATVCLVGSALALALLYLDFGGVHVGGIFGAASLGLLGVPLVAGIALIVTAVWIGVSRVRKKE